MAKSRKVASLLDKKRKISREIENFQNDCKNFNKSIKSIPESVDSSTFIIRWVCDECERIIGIPNDEEINNYLN